VVSDLLGVSGRAMLQAMIAGERDPKRLAELARGRLRGKRGQLIEALTGHFDDHHAFLCRMMLDRIDALTGQIATLTTKVEALIAPFQTRVDQHGRRHRDRAVLRPGADRRARGNMGCFPSADHLVSWARHCRRPASQQAAPAPPPAAKATRGWLPPSARSPSPPPAPIPSWAPATAAWPNAAASAALWSRSATRC
jgi:transposase